MIQINDSDTPIQVAEKIISGTKEVKANSIDKAILRTFGDTRTEIDTIQYDMFDLQEIKEISGYLSVYYEAHKKAESEDEE